MSKGGGSQTTTQKNEPAAFVAPMLSEAANEAQNLYQNYRPEYFTGSAFVPFSPETELALQAQTQRAISGSPVQAVAQDEAIRTLSGGYMDGNPYLQKMLSDEYGRIGGAINSQFATGGGYGSSANQEVLAREMSKAATQALANNYEAERGRQTALVGAAPAIASSDYADIEALSNVGARREDLFGRQLQDQIARFEFEMSQDPNALDQYINRLTQLSSGFGTQSVTQPSAKRSIIPTLLSGAEIAGGLGWSPFK